MKISTNYAKKFTCPRCGLRCYEGIETCPDCGLVFSRLEIATNKDAKQKMRRHDHDFIIMTSKLPSDVSRTKLILYTIFFGVFGGHCFYVGRYWRGATFLTTFIAMFLMVVFNSSLAAIGNGALLGVLSTILGFIMLMWPWDIFMVVLKKFKVPIAIDLESNGQNKPAKKSVDLKSIINSDENTIKEDTTQTKEGEK